MSDEQMAQGQTAAPEQPKQDDKPVTRTWTDAPASANVRATIGGHDWQLTLRADTFAQLSERIPVINDWLDKHGGRKHNGQTQPAQAAPQPQAAPAVTPSAQSAQPQAITTKPIIEVGVVRVEIVPQTDGKAQARFYAEGHKYPDVACTRTVQSLVDLMSKNSGMTWTAENFAGANGFDVSLKVGYTLSDKLNTKGNPYKDIQYVKAA